MKLALPENAKIAKEAKECMQECVSEFISFITSEGGFFSHHPPPPPPLLPFFSPVDPSGNEWDERPLTGPGNIWHGGSSASEKCQQEKRKTVNGEDILFAMTSLGFENYAEALKIYLTKYREVGLWSWLCS